MVPHAWLRSGYARASPTEPRSKKAVRHNSTEFLARSGVPNSPAVRGDAQALPLDSVSKCIVLNQGSPGEHDELLAMGSGASKTPAAPTVIHAAPEPAGSPVHEKLASCSSQSQPK